MTKTTHIGLVCAAALAASCGTVALAPIDQVPETMASSSMSAHGSTSSTMPSTSSSGGGGASAIGGGAPSDGGGGASVGAGGGGATCKRGVASNATPSAGLVKSAAQPGVAWWYDWSPAAGTGAAGLEFVPMIWGSMDLGASLPEGSRFVLGFNEPNLVNQADMTPAQAAAAWPEVVAAARAVGVPIVSPALTYCSASSCRDPAITDPYTWLKDFFQACPSCEVDYVAVHWYNCDLPSLQSYIDGGPGFEGFVQFGKPVWLTEFSCDGSHSVEDQEAYMQAAVPYVEANPNVFRYAWFSADPIPSALLQGSDGAPTELGQLYASLAAPGCP